MHLFVMLVLPRVSGKVSLQTDYASKGHLFLTSRASVVDKFRTSPEVLLPKTPPNDWGKNCCNVVS